MKKLLTGLAVLVLALCTINVVSAEDMEGLYDNYQAVYLPSTNTWSMGAMSEDRIVLIKKTTEGTGGYSEYNYSNGKLAVALHSNFEFIKDGKLIAVDNASLKYYEVIYKDKKFEEKLLSQEDLEKIFPYTQIVKISQFENNKITIKKPLFKKINILLVNDTDKYFHKYSYTPKDVQETDIKGLLRISHYGKIKFSLFGIKDNMLTIKVR